MLDCQQLCDRSKLHFYTGAFLKLNCVSQLENQVWNLSRIQCSKTLESMGLIAIPLKSSQATDFVRQSFNIFGTGIYYITVSKTRRDMTIQHYGVEIAYSWVLQRQKDDCRPKSGVQQLALRHRQLYHDVTAKLHCLPTQYALLTDNRHTTVIDTPLRILFAQGFLPAVHY